MAIKKIVSRAPTRIDLAGGTVDIWPLYLFLKNPVTLNLGIDLYAEATIQLSLEEKSNPKEITLQSFDQKNELSLSWDALESDFTPPPSLELHYKLLKYFYEKRKTSGLSTRGSTLHFSTRAQSPAGAGLGGSSALSIAMIGALASWANPKPGYKVNPSLEGEAFIEIVRDVETTVIQVPAGLQDYYGAMYGGLQSLAWGTGTHQQTYLPHELITELEGRLLLFYSGQSRNSGINNWALFKGFIDREDHIREKFMQIVQATQKLENALRNQNWSLAGQAIAEEWSVRKTLAQGITTPEIDRAFEEAQKLAPLAGKVCGAGGGGCFFIFIPSQTLEAARELKDKIQNIFIQQGMRPLPFHGVPKGLEVTLTEA